MDRGLPSHSWSPSELKAQLDAASHAHPFVVYRSKDGRQQLIELSDAASRVTIGRAEGCDVLLDCEQVSRLHAEILRIGPEWVISDDGLSRNGTFLNGERIVARRRLRDGDAVRVGSTNMLYRGPVRSTAATREGNSLPTAADMSPTQRRILAALCRPFQQGSGFATPPTNVAIADEVGLSADRVKAHLRALYELFGVGALPQHAKRMRLAELVMESGLVSRSDV